MNFLQLKMCVTVELIWLVQITVSKIIVQLILKHFSTHARKGMKCFLCNNPYEPILAVIIWGKPENVHIFVAAMIMVEKTEISLMDHRTVGGLQPPPLPLQQQQQQQQ